MLGALDTTTMLKTENNRLGARVVQDSIVGQDGGQDGVQIESFPFEIDPGYGTERVQVSNAFHPDHLTGRTLQEVESERKPVISTEALARAKQLIDEDES